MLRRGLVDLCGGRHLTTSTWLIPNPWLPQNHKRLVLNRNISIGYNLSEPGLGRFCPSPSHLFTDWWLRLRIIRIMGLPTTEDLDKEGFLHISMQCGYCVVPERRDAPSLGESCNLGTILSESTAVGWFHTIDGAADRTEALPRPTVETHDWYRE